MTQFETEMVKEMVKEIKKNNYSVNLYIFLFFIHKKKFFIMNNVCFVKMNNNPEMSLSLWFQIFGLLLQFLIYVIELWNLTNILSCILKSIICYFML